MAGRTLEEYFVSLGIKGQNTVVKEIDKVKKKSDALSKIKPVQLKAKNTVLKEIDKVKKKASDLSKTKPVQLKAKAGLFGGVSGNNIIPPQQPSPEQKSEDRKRTNNEKKFGKQFGDSVKSFARSAEGFDPVSVVQSGISSIGKSFSNINVLGTSLGNLPEGVANIINSMVSMASGAVNLSKSSASTQYGLENRNATAKYYGGAFAEEKRNEKGEIEETFKNRSNLSNSQFSELIMQVSGSYGKIQKPMQGILDELVKSKNTDALSRVASGNWSSTGTDKGWMLQQIANETAGLPPSIAQAIQSSLLKNYSGEIQDKGREKDAQGINAAWMNQSERQNKDIFNATSKNYDNLIALSDKFNTMQIKMVESGVGFASAIDKATNAILELPKTIDKARAAMDKLHVPEWARPSILGK